MMKLLRKERMGAKVKKTYDRPRTPYQRLASSSALSRHAKHQLARQYARLNPAELKRNIVRLQTKLLKSGIRQRPLAAVSRDMRYHSDTTRKDLRLWQ